MRSVFLYLVEVASAFTISLFLSSVNSRYKLIFSLFALNSRVVIRRHTAGICYPLGKRHSGHRVLDYSLRDCRRVPESRLAWVYHSCRSLRSSFAPHG